MLKLFQYYMPALFFMALFIVALKKAKFKFSPSQYKEQPINYILVFLIGLYCVSALLIGFIDEENWYPYFHTSSYTFKNWFFAGSCGVKQSKLTLVA